MLKILMFFLSLNVFADQSGMLLKGRDRFIKDAQKLLKNYCEEGDSYLCLVQMKSDCSHGDEAKKAYACKTLSKVEALEKSIVVTDKSLKEMELIKPAPPIAKTNPPAPPEFEAKPIQVPEVYRNLKLRLGLSQKKEGTEDYKVIKDLLDKIQAYKVRMDCVTAEDCALQDYGKWGCGGPSGTFVYSIRTNIPSLKSDIEQITKLDKEYQEKWNRDLYSTCALENRTTPPTCIENQCQ